MFHLTRDHSHHFAAQTQPLKISQSRPPFVELAIQQFDCHGQLRSWANTSSSCCRERPQTPQFNTSLFHKLNCPSKGLKPLWQMTSSSFFFFLLLLSDGERPVPSRARVTKSWRGFCAYPWASQMKLKRRNGFRFPAATGRKDALLLAGSTRALTHVRLGRERELLLSLLKRKSSLLERERIEVLDGKV